MSICSKYNDEKRKQLDKTQYMRMASYDDILQLTDIVFDVAVLIRESTDSDEQKKAFAVQKDMVLELIDKKANFRLSSSNIFEELNEEMSAFKAHKYSLEGKLKSAKAFHCHDPYCGIKLTYSNWAVKDAKRIYFTPSNRDDLHSIACSTVSGDEEKRQVEVETEQGKRTISKNGIIAMSKATNKSKTNHSNEHGVEDVDVVTGERRNTSRCKSYFIW